MVGKKESPAALRQRRSNQNDESTEAMLFQGANITQIAKLFRMERRDVTPKIMDVAPCGQRGGYPIYFIHEVAPHLVRPIYDVETYLKRMHPNDLPKTLTKEFWAGMKGKMDYELARGDLWETDRVLEHCSEAFKMLRMALLLAGDTVEREITFTTEQREKLRVIIDGALNDCADRLLSGFEKLAEEEENGESDEEEI